MYSTGNHPSFAYTFLVFSPIIILLYDIKWLNRICSNKFIKWLGNISFGIYLWNFPILITLHLLYTFNIMNIPIDSMQFFIINFFIHILIASISNLLIDKLLGNRLKQKLNNVMNYINMKDDKKKDLV